MIITFPTLYYNSVLISTPFLMYLLMLQVKILSYIRIWIQRFLLTNLSNSCYFVTNPCFRCVIVSFHSIDSWTRQSEWNQSYKKLDGEIFYIIFYSLFFIVKLHHCKHNAEFVLGSKWSGAFPIETTNWRGKGTNGLLFLLPIKRCNLWIFQGIKAASADEVFC